MALSDIIIHVEDRLDAEQVAALGSVLRQQQGVVAVKIPPDAPGLVRGHVILVSYDPGAVPPRRLLSRVTRDGVRATLLDE